MIDITDWPVIAKLIFVLSPFVVGLPGIMLSVYTTITKDYEIVCSAITSNPYFESVKRAWGGGNTQVAMVAGLYRKRTGCIPLVSLALG
ncbi:hypothetical protein EC849_102246 [Pseudomonas putida]|uniref:hypothetical protein n=1 Tax=Pseudomonas putida TaxID=303 RepID=UPI00104CD3BF|nr:hypothetical protein [Pseudomonas putida]TCP78411.1 hypothetical protein EC849_102246 [Pseudomonas putida]